MNTPASVEGCTSCGALYEATPGDKGVCAACRRLLPAEPPWRAPSSPTLAGKPTPGKPTPGSTKPIGAFKRPGVSSAQRSNFGARSALRRIAMAAAVAALLVVAAGASLSSRPRTLSDAWTALRRQTPAGAWAAMQRHASEAWIAVRRRLPFDAGVPPPPRGAIRDANATRGGTHHRTPGKTNAVAKRGRDETGRSGSTP
ncbi:MAG: hypothetical protein ACJ79H_17045 [Myxococcales bacterium]